MDDEDEYVGLPFDPMSVGDADIFTWDCAVKLAQITGSAIEGTPVFKSDPAGLAFDAITVASPLVNVRITDTALTPRGYRVKMTMITSAGQTINRQRWLEVCDQ